MRFNADLDSQSRDLFESVLDRMAEKVAADERRLGVEFPHVTREDGSWVTWPASISAGYTERGWSHGNWTCGFWVGLLLASFLRTGETRYLDWARERMRLVAPRAADPNTHDISFIFDSSAIPMFHIAGEAGCRTVALEAADRLRARVVATPSGAYIAAWGPLSDPRGRASSAIDTMANLPLLYWAARQTGDDSYRLVAEAHARKTYEAFVRADGSTWHAVEYDTATGVRRRGFTFQGYRDESLWSRGQGWAIYGSAVSARETGDPSYLAWGERLAEHYVTRLGGRLIPPWDFDDPTPNPTRDTSAAGIVASALIELAALHPDPSRTVYWHGPALNMLETLCRDAFAIGDEQRGLLKHSCYSRPHEEGVDGATMFGDFYFVEALCKIVMPGRFRPETKPLRA